MLERAARRAGFTGAEADELLQSVWATFLEIVPRFEGRSQVRTFLLGILRRKAAEARRARRGRSVATDPQELDAADGVGSDPHDALADAEVRRVVRGCIEQLPDVERRAIELRVLEERDVTTVGRALGVTANYLGVLLHRARAHLRHCVMPHFG